MQYSLINYNKLTLEHKSLIPDFNDNCYKIKELIEKNQEFINRMIQDAEFMFKNQEFIISQMVLINLNLFTVNIKESFIRILKTEEELNREISLYQMDKVVTTLKQIVRDWSNDGKQERDICYRPILNDLNELYDSIGEKRKISILVPGCGLGRLAFEIAKLGFKCEGNEFSMFMLITSNFILNKYNLFIIIINIS